MEKLECCSNGETDLDSEVSDIKEYLDNVIKSYDNPSAIHQRVVSLSREDLTSYAGDLDNAPIRLPWSKVSYLTHHDGKVVAKLLARPELKWKKLCIQFNSLGDIGAVEIFKALKRNTRLELLFFEGNELTDVSALACAEMLKVNKTIQKIHLDFNYLTDVGALAIADALTVHPSMCLLDISFNKMTSKGKDALRKATENKKDFSLWLKVPCP